jgi:CBS domain containing-hemolysin-like protein
MGWLLAGIILFVLMVLAEKALIAVTPHELEMLRAEGTPSARRVIYMADESNRRSLAAIAIGKLFTILLLTIQFVKIIHNSIWFQKTILFLADQNIPTVLTKVFFVGASLLVLTFLLWRISQINLKRAQRPIAGFWLQRLQSLIRFSRFVFRPFLPRTPKPEKEPEAHPHPPSDDNPLPSDTVKRDIELLKSIAKFGDVTVKQVMQPQLKMVALERQTPFSEVLQTIRTSEFSRIPVYEDDLDNMVGVLYVKDLVSAIDEPPDFDWVQRVRPDVFIVPETKPVDELLREFKLRKLHLALVVDEYGGTAGLVTMEDILEEVTGEIRDEFDEENEIPPYRQIDACNYLFAGATMINDVCEITGIDPETFENVREDADTIAGLTLELIGDIPAKGDQVQWGQYLITVEKADNRRIEEVRFTILDEGTTTAS